MEQLVSQSQPGLEISRFFFLLLFKKVCSVQVLPGFWAFLFFF